MTPSIDGRVIPVDPDEPPWDAEYEDELLRRYLLDNPDALSVQERVSWAERCGLPDVVAVLTA